MSEPVKEIVRIPPRHPDDFDPLMKEVATRTKPGPDGLPFRHYGVYANNAWFLERWMRLAGTIVMRSSLSEREKMMTIMRVSYRLRCSFAWVQRQSEKDPSFNIPSLHGKPQEAGIGEDEIAAIARPLSEWNWGSSDRALLMAVDETKDNGGISSPTWLQLAATHDQTQLYDLVVLIGYYLLTCSTINSMGVQNYPGDPVSPWEQIDNGSPA